jgi:hypothetical protein
LPTFDQHLNQANKNIKHLELINKLESNCIDWQITVCFYTGLHIVNCHLCGFGIEYNTHTNTLSAINFTNPTSLTKVSEDCYTSYRALQNLSRKSRYLIDPSSKSFGLVYSKHLAKAMRHLEVVIKYFSTLYSQKIKIEKIKVKCDELNNKELDYFIKI